MQNNIISMYLYNLHPKISVKFFWVGRPKKNSSGMNEILKMSR